MVGFLRRWLITFIAVFIAAYFLPWWVSYLGLLQLAIFAAILAVLNAIVRPVLIILTLPLNIITLGLFILVINALLFWLAAAIVPGVAVSGFPGAFFAALVVSIVSFISSRLLK